VPVRPDAGCQDVGDGLKRTVLVTALIHAIVKERTCGRGGGKSLFGS
jgi:hypothetical protein